MIFTEFHNLIHQRNFLILCLNDYKMNGQFHTFIAIQDKFGHGFHAEGLSENVSEVYEQLIEKLKTVTK
jgi:hypothetical protein